MLTANLDTNERDKFLIRCLEITNRIKEFEAVEKSARESRHAFEKSLKQVVKDYEISKRTWDIALEKLAGKTFKLSNGKIVKVVRTIKLSGLGQDPGHEVWEFEEIQMEDA